MKKIKTLALSLICILALTLSLTSCDFLKYGFFDEEGNFVGLDNLFGNNDEENEDIFDIQGDIQAVEPYTLNYISNGDGTCYVTVKVNNVSLMSVNRVEEIERKDVFDFSINDKYFAGNNDVIVVNPSEGVINGNDAVIVNPSIGSDLAISISRIEIEIPSQSPDGDTVTGVGNSNFLVYPNVPRMLDKDTFEILLNNLREGLGNDTAGQFNYQKVMSYYALQDPESTVSDEIRQEMQASYPVTKAVAVYVLDPITTLDELATLSELLGDYAGYTAEDSKSDFDSFKLKVAEKDSAIADTLDFGNMGYKIARVVLPVTVTEIDDYAFAGCYNMEHIEIHSDINEIGEGAFYGCKQLQTVHLHNGNLTEIEDRAFMLCEELRNISLPYGVEEIGEEAFYGCRMLDVIDIPQTLRSIGGRAFYGCESLGSIYIPEATTYIGANAFMRCNSLVSADFERLDSWECIDSEGETFDITLSDSQMNATYLTVRWPEYAWTRR